ncbi:smoothelin-like [Sinocyclocheilus anshuiensis]|uniref:smoothelin-like n=1 Tax=Sinocyclocheilus anshuiensis TaxID=1608454 RepID=UPI0007BA9CEA|nr:PREDICTED: smoothelin-like [Sinocyclocheilus anshuiensis]XP_016341872.1 PREDICTED: smoothelin-like [Sinocyclocheilus anshuiensis]
MEGEKGTLEAGTKEQPDTTGPLTVEQLAAIEDEEILNNMLDKAVDFEERKMIRAAMRELLKRKRERRDRERVARMETLRQQGGGGKTAAGLNKDQKPANGPSGAQYKAHRMAQAKTFSPPTSTSSPKAVGSPAQSHAARVKVPGGSAVGGPNTKDVKQMLLDWCRVKTEPYEGVNIQNFSSSWADGLAFCALVHRFFPESFEYCTLDPYDRRANFEKAFKTAERLADCPPLLDVDDLMRMREPDWKCVYTYIQEFYRCLVEKGLVKTKKKMP